MKFSTKMFSISGVTIGIASFIWGGSEGLHLAENLGQTTGTMVGFAVIWFVFSRIEFQINGYMRKRSVQKGDKSDDTN